MAEEKANGNTSDPASETVTVAEATEQVRLMTRRAALMYHHIAQILVEQLGKERAKELLKEGIWRYGSESGAVVRAGVQALGLPLTVDNYGCVPDLPHFGWESDWHQDEDGSVRPKVVHCPLAAVWLEKGSQELGRIYCSVDQAKFLSYNGIRCTHERNLLDGDDGCLFAFSEPGE